MVGFVIAPKSTNAIYKSPPYADSTLYKEEFITINSGGHSLAGMLTTPKGISNFPVVVLVHGSGPSDMDETIGPNKPFKDLASGLAAKGIATIRYVKRTMIYPNEFSKVFTVKEEVLDDALAAIAFARTLPAVDKKQIYLLGHSLGGMLAPRIAALAPDLNGIILAEAPAVKLTDIMIEQNKYMYALSKDTTAATKKQFENAMHQLELTRLLKLGAIAPDSLLLGVPASYWVDLNQYDQLATAKKLKNRLLIIQGEHDFQVSAKDYNLWKSTLINNKNATFKLYPDLNHLLASQPEKGTVEQYGVPSNVAANVIADIASWIKAK
jgi:dienelactone hydrolase